MSPLQDNTDFPQGQERLDTQITSALGGKATDDGHQRFDAQSSSAVVGSDHPARQYQVDAQVSDAGGDKLAGPDAIAGATTNGTSRPVLLDPVLTLSCVTVDDLERQRIAQENRYRSLTRSGTSENGLEWGYGLDDRDPSVAAAGAILDGIRDLEKQAVRQLEKQMKAHPLGPWVKAQKGAGNKTVARLLGAIGDPYWHTVENRPRTVSELWAYTGHKPGQRRRKGERANWSDDAKKRTYLIAAGFVKQLDAQCKREGGIAEHQDGCKCSPYRKVYDARRAHTRENVHATECVRCGPSGKPAQPGTPWSAAHQMADAVRVTGKTFLRDMWREARRLHGEDN